MEKYTVDSISKYLSILEKYGIDKFVYRGQNEPYFSIQANGFRTYKGGWNSDKIYDMPHLHKEFYNKVIGRLSDDEKRHFLAYCQHHGIPTNLIDISYSPLVALFFACYGKKEFQISLSDFISNHTIEDIEEDINGDASLSKMLIHNLINQYRKPFYSRFAQLYAIRKQRLIDITDIIIELDGRNLFEELLTDKNLVTKLFKRVNNHFNQNITGDIAIEWLNNILELYDEVYDFFNENKSELYNKVKKVLSRGNNQQIIKNLLDEIMQKDIYNYYLSISISDLYKEEQNINTIALIYINILIDILENIKSMPRKIGIYLDIYFTYKPPEIFKRIAMQQGFFIYQSYLYTNDGVYDYCELNTQYVRPDVIIQIDNYNNIIDDLDTIGINNGNIYGDIDNMAKSVLRSSGRLFHADEE